MVRKLIICGLFIIVSLMTLNVQAHEQLSLDMDWVVKNALNNPPYNSQLYRLNLDSSKPQNDIKGMLIPRVSFEVSQFGDSNLVYQVNLQGYLTNLILVKDRLEYNQFLQDKYDLELVEARRSVMLSLANLYLLMVENLENQKIFEEYYHEIDGYYNSLIQRTLQGKIDIFALNEAKMTLRRVNFLMTDMKNKYIILENDLFTLLSKVDFGDAEDITIEITENLKEIQSKYGLNRKAEDTDLNTILAQNPSIQISEINYRLEKLNGKIENFKRIVPDISYNLGYNIGNGSNEWRWSINVGWNWTNSLGRSNVQVHLSEWNRSVQASLNQDNGGSERSLQERLLSSENHTRVKVYETRTRATQIFNQLNELEILLDLALQGVGFLELQLNHVRSWSDDEEKWLTMINLLGDLVQAKLEYNSHLKNYLVLQLQLKFALEEISHL